MSRSPDELLAQARQAVDLVQATPIRAEQLAERVLSDPASNLAALATARWALGLVERERDRLGEANVHLATAIDIAHEGGHVSLGAQIQSSLALVYAYLGDNPAALAATQAAAANLKGGDAARNRMQQGLILQRIGDLPGALSAYRLALAGFKRGGDEIAEVRLRLNRAVIHAYRGDLTLAVSDLETAIATARRNRQALQVAACAHNLAWVHGRRGDVPAALQMFDVAEASYLEVDAGGARPAVLAIDHAEVLAAAGLLDEAWEQTMAAVNILAAGDNAVDLAEARLLAARVALARDDPTNAGILADQAQVSFDKQQRTAWELQARWLGLRARLEGRFEETFDDEAAAGLVADLEDRGWEAEAVAAGFETGRLALASGNTGLGTRLLEAAARPRKGSALTRAQGRHAAALLALSTGHRREAGAAIRTGLRSLLEYRASFGSAELRAQASATSRALANLSIGLALETGKPWQILTAIESSRAIAMQLPAVRPPRDRALAEGLSALRALDAEIAEALTRSASTVALQARRGVLERSVRNRARRAAGSIHRPLATLDRDEVGGRLADTALVAFFSYEGSLRAVTMAGRRIRVSVLGPLQPVVEDIHTLVFALHRLALGRSSAASLLAAADLCNAAASALSQRLIEPLGASIGDRPLVIVPTGALHRLPWLSLATLQGRPVVVAPSVRTWLWASSRLRPISRQSRAILASGPGLDGATREVRLLARRYEQRTLLTGRRATGDALKAGLAHAEVAHIAVHGSFRTDNPLFSSLHLADGPLTIYDLEMIRTLPQLMVMPACDVAVSDVLAGDELLGLATALLRLGSRTLVAPVVPIPDGATAELMLAFHGELLKGRRPSEALAVATASFDSDEASALAVRSAFIVLGAD